MKAFLFACLGITTIAHADDIVERGRYLATAGDCASCHTARNGKPFAGGRVIATPFGPIPAPNLTPDAETGIGGWSADDFFHALHEGKGRDGTSLYPAFPFTSYTKVTRADCDAIFAWLKTLPAVRQPALPDTLRFPYRMRWLMGPWRTIFFDAGEYVADASRPASWNRGAYLVQGLGHCNECHARRNSFGAPVTEPFLAGGIIPVQNWYAPDLSMGVNGGLAGWSEADVVTLLKTGRSSRGTALGPMADVVMKSTRHLTDDDLAAIATYLKSLPDPEPRKPGESIAGAKDLVANGRGTYERQCAACHGDDGRGKGDAYPPLDRNPTVTDPTGINVIRAVLSGGFSPATEGNPRPYSMPPFSQRLDDDEVAGVVSYIRQAWSNKASAVSPGDVRAYRSVPGE
ncbi:cytochrome c [Luteibacter sp.]|uniref:cytochrome c n=1 Tax=Luteibacter sp. TaxID=1886636 RepID=UPI0025BF0394|nr:cytochrome c [Luteibacter sp.]